MNEYLQQPAVVGAAGKMGSGIAFLVLREMACLKASQKMDGMRLTLVDEVRVRSFCSNSI